MNTLVIYESQFGNTARIARAIATVLAGHATTRLEPIDYVGHHVLEGVDLLVLGSPTQDHAATSDMLAWLGRVPPGALLGRHVAVFDTRYHLPQLLSGSAAQKIGQEVQHLGGKLVAPPESFFVIEREGPLEAREVERAVSWATTLLDTLQAQATPEGGA